MFVFALILSVQSLLAVGESPISPADWQYVMGLSVDKKVEIFDQKKNLSDWHWSWRILWVKTCKEKKHQFCHKALKEGLSDRALVVRAEAAQTIGEVYAEQEAGLAIWAERLKRAFLNPRNYRNNRPLYVQKHIIFALKKMGSHKEAQILARTNSELATYWNKLKIL